MVREITLVEEDEATEHALTEAVDAARAAAKKSAGKKSVVLTSTSVGGATSASAMPVPTTASVAVAGRHMDTWIHTGYLALLGPRSRILSSSGSAEPDT